QLTVSWVDVPHFFVPGSAVTFQVILREGSEDILFQYQDVVFGSSTYDYGRDATVGIENAEGTDGRQYSYNQASLSNASALRFYRNNGENSPPIANPGGPYQTGVNQPLTFKGSASYDP